ncbi:PRC-barrel domain-containing protein [Sphingomonas sp.]|uniref:PRC-barrel domain-containing protein n=1 Tax=Sphingomonas sp. TaxID=28214 RepID=UPI0017EC7295|nr:PRC-barrel domain-containing protein [Sphingomonas sp.]MBA3511349.1 PRC-barrel domain-containing protein [Sphingomonas sp.]
METSLSWVATIATVTAASIVASNLGARITGYGFIIFTVGSLAWLGVGLASDQIALVWTNIALTFLNLFGIWRWLGRQARVEDGSRAAARASHSAPGEDLFPVSLLAGAKVRSGTSDLGSCVDAMAGCRSGRIAYVMVSEGGFAGAGEHLRRLPWNELHVDDDAVVTRLDAARFCRLDPVPKDEWPAR